MEVVTLASLEQSAVHDLRLFTPTIWNELLLNFGGQGAAENDVPGFMSWLRKEGVPVEGTIVPFLSAHQCAEIQLGRASQLRLRSPDEEVIIVEPLGKGGQGTVFLVRFRRPNSPEVIKAAKVIVNTEVTELARKRFERESQILCETRDLSKDGASCVVLGECFFTDRDRSVLVMNYVDGVPLDRAAAKLLTENRYVRLYEGLRLTRPFLSGLGFLHSSGLIHRDLKPKNLMCKLAGSHGEHQVIIVDLGSVKISNVKPNASMEEITGAVGGLGSYYFSAPETMSHAKGVGVQADIYSAAATLHFLLTGEPPAFELHMSTKVTDKALIDFTHWLAGTAELNSLRIDYIRDDIPKSLSETLNKCLNVDPKKRPNSVAVLTESIDLAINGIESAQVALDGLMALRRLYRRFIKSACQDICTYRDDPSLAAKSCAESLGRVINRYNKTFPGGLKVSKDFTLFAGYLSTVKKAISGIMKLYELLRKFDQEFGATPEIMQRKKLNSIILKMQQKMADLLSAEQLLRRALIQLR